MLCKSPDKRKAQGMNSTTADDPTMCLDEVITLVDSVVTRLTFDL
jgi:hypothetical protein